MKEPIVILKESKLCPSLADLGNSYAVVREMRIVPVGLRDITRLVVATGAPLLPLLLTIMRVAAIN
jgi:hypothetical protein